MTARKLWLIGSDEALDIIAELSRHLDYFEVVRSDEPPPETLGEDDHIVIGLEDHARSVAVLGRVLARSAPGHAALLPDGGGAGERAILAAAALVNAVRAAATG